MAEDTVDHVVAHVLGAEVTERIARRGRTRRLKLRGAEGYRDLTDRAATISRSIDAATVGHLANRFGGEARTVIAMAERDPVWPSRWCPACPPQGRGRLRRATRWRTLDDILCGAPGRLSARDGSSQSPEVALVAEDLGWDADDRPSRWSSIEP
jgi:glycerol-3-phosphate dehydrogenase